MVSLSPAVQQKENSRQHQELTQTSPVAMRIESASPRRKQDAGVEGTARRSRTPSSDASREKFLVRIETQPERPKWLHNAADGRLGDQAENLKP